MATTTSDHGDTRETYTRTVVVPTRHLTERKRGLLNRKMKHYLRVQQYVAKHLQQGDVSAFDMTYTAKNELRKEIAAQDDVNLGAHSIQAAMTEIIQNYKEFEKDPAATHPWPESATSVAFSAQTAYLFADGGAWYFSVPAVNGHLIVPLLVSDDGYHQEIFPDEVVAPDAGRRPGIPLEDFEPTDFASRVTSLGQCAVMKTHTGAFQVHFSVKREKKVVRDGSTHRYYVGVDRGRNELFYAALYDKERDHVLDWRNISGDPIEDTMDKLAERISAYQRNNAIAEIPKLRQRRHRFKRQKDFEAANEIVALARSARAHGGLTGEAVEIVLEELSGMNQLGNYARENRRFNEWSHYRLEQAVEDKAEPYDISVSTVDPDFTSQHCSRCGAEDAHRSGIHFTCTVCGYDAHADANAAVNVAKRGSE